MSSMLLEVDDVEYESSETRFPAYMSLLMTLSCGLILVVGLIGNCLVPVVIWNNRDLRNSTNLFLLNLSLADILVLCISMPTVLVEIQRPEVWKLGQVMCKFSTLNFFFIFESTGSWVFVYLANLYDLIRALFVCRVDDPIHGIVDDRLD